MIKYIVCDQHLFYIMFTFNPVEINCFFCSKWFNTKLFFNFGNEFLFLF